jgi:hypothetical protein
MSDEIPARLSILGVNAPTTFRAKYTLLDSSSRVFSSILLLFASLVHQQRDAHRHLQHRSTLKFHASHAGIYRLPTVMRVITDLYSISIYFSFSLTQLDWLWTSQYSIRLFHGGVIAHSVYFLIQIPLTTPEYLRVTRNDMEKNTKWLT